VCYNLHRQCHDGSTALTSTRDESPEVGYHYRLELEDSAVEVDLFRSDPDRDVFLEVFGARGSDSQPDSVVVCLPLDRIPSLTGALMDVWRRGNAERTKAQAAKKKGTK